MSPIMRLDQVQQFAAINLLVDPGAIHGPKIIPNTAQIKLNWSLTDGRIAHNFLYANYTGSPAFTNTIAQQVYAALIAGAGWTGMAAFIASTTSLTGVSLLDIRSSAGHEFNSTGAAAPGTAAGVALPDEVAICVTLGTANRGPSGRGRIYLPGWASGAAGTSGTINAATVSAITAWLNNVGTAVGIIGGMVLALPARQAYTSPVTGRQFPARAAGNVPITTLAVRDNHWDSQRRRGLK